MDVYQVTRERIAAVQEQAVRDLVRANAMLNDEVAWLREEVRRLQAIVAETNPYLKPESEPFAALSDGTPLYPAYYPLQPGERSRCEMGRWSGQIGQWVGTTLDGQLFRQRQLWGGDKPHPDRWEAFGLGYQG
jgi:hypothetical protein